MQERPIPRPASHQPQGLLGDPAQRFRWKAWLAEARTTTPVAHILASHPQAASLTKGFSVGAYLAGNADVAEAVSDPAEAVFHFLEFTAADPAKRPHLATYWEPPLVARIHGQTLHPDLSAMQAASRLIARGIPVQDIVLCERDLWLSLGLHGPSLTGLFHPEVYAVLAADHVTPPAPDRLSCIRHFAAHGLDAGIPAHPDHRLDPAFYAASLAERGLRVPTALPRHWARVGLRLGLQANAQAQALAMGLSLPRTGLCGLPIPSAGALHEIVEDPTEAMRRLDASTSDQCRFLLDLARLKQRNSAGEEAALTQATALLSHVPASNPDHPQAALALADIKASQGALPLAMDLRAKAPPDIDTGRNRLAMAEGALLMGDIDRALSLAEGLCPQVQADVPLRRRLRAHGRAVFHALWHHLTDHLTRNDISTVQSFLTRAISLYAPRPDLLRRKTAIRRVAILANDDIYQCKLYRADQKVEQLRAQGLTVRLFLQSCDVETLRAALAQYDAVIFQRSPAFPAIAEVMITANRLGLATFYDIDDQIFDPALFPPPLAEYAGQIDAEQHARAACGVPLFAAAAGLCDIGIASTDALRDALAPLTLSATAFTHRNGMGALHQTAAKTGARAPSDKLVIFYGSGTRAHKGAFRDSLEPALARVLAAHPGRVEVRLMGEFPDLHHLDPNHDDVTLRPPLWDFEAYLSELSQADIALSVLEHSAVTDAKSELKWMEPAVFAIPSVVTPTATIAQVVQDGVTGLLAHDSQGFFAQITRLIGDEDLRRGIGQAAQDRVNTAYTVPALGAPLLAHMGQALAPDTTRLLVANVFYPPQAIGGATRVVADNIAHLSAHHGDRFSIDVVTTLHDGGAPHRLHPVSQSGTRIWSITADPARDPLGLHDPRMDARLEEVFDSVDPQIVHIHCIQHMGIGLIDLCRKRGIPYVITLHDGFWASPQQFILGPDGAPDLYDFTAPATLPARAKIARRCLDGAAAVLAVSEPFAALHRSIGLPMVTALPNGLQALPERDYSPPRDGRVRLALIGGAARHKGYDILRAAIMARSLANIDLLVVDYALPVGARARKEIWNTTPVTRIPRQSQDRIGRLYGSFDVLLAPSVWPESYGLVAREALALGLWVVASDRGAMAADIVEGETGHIVSVDDHHGLADILARIDADPARYARAPHGTPSLTDSSVQAEELATLYRRILAGSGSG